MALTTDQKERISEVVKNILISRLETFPELNTAVRNAPFHDLFLDAFKDRLGPLNIETPYLVAIASWMHGLSTSLGSGFENLAHIISGGYKRRFTGPYELKVKRSQSNAIGDIIRDLKSNNLKPNVIRENKLIFTYPHDDEEHSSLGFTADNYNEDDKSITAIELKSVRPNSGEGRGEKEKILFGKAALRLLSPEKEIRFYIGFPFDPTSDKPTSYDKERFFNYLIEFKKFFAADEVLLGPELWDHLSGTKHTMGEILDTISSVIKRSL